ncbi:Integrase catalytic region [Parafrankia sp. EAN1pec]|uniref:IS630 family transposase n=1 Tax=Parafrankia sp. (strain EAN1pec) TaxID=298653 RepID=UPI000054357A|nr:Integrase catalytic region [Frankia sp. EAN1pec]
MILTDNQRNILESLAGGGGYDRSAAARARMVLWRDEGFSVREIAEKAGASKPTVRLWLSRYDEEGPDGLLSRVSPGRPREVPGRVRARILALTRTTPPPETGLSHWTSTEMARYLKRREGVSVSHTFVAQLWRENNLQPHRHRVFKLSADPDFEAKVEDVVGLYLDPPEGAEVLSIDEKPGVQARDRTQPPRPVASGRVATRTHDYQRKGTTDLFAALDVGTGRVTARCFPSHTRADFLTFMDQVIAEYGGAELHVVVDNLATHYGPDVDTWLRRHKNVTFHFTPSGSSWLNQVENWFGILTRHALQHGAFVSVQDLVNTINNYVKNWNWDAHPFEWTATTEEIVAKVEVLHREFRKLLANNL